ncbi:MAG: enoyl-CoA hydratase/isomerase family protein [Syntrophomonadaceae bacterium]|jgi:enoyl-CoA hydratase/carnithine racemase
MHSNTEWLELAIEERVATITIDVPPVNAITEGLLDELGTVWQNLKQQELAAIILTGKNEFFSAGADIKSFPARSPEENQIFFQTLYQVLNEIENCSIPVIAAINGYALGGGLELALCADFRIADQNARMGATGVNLGLVFCTQRLPRLIGYSRAKEMLFTARMVEAAEAVRTGLVEQMVEPGLSLFRAQEIAHVIAGKSLPAVMGVKQALQAGTNKSLKEGLQSEAGILKQMLVTKEFQDRVQRFLEKK